jgi:hypothetical protein
VSADPQAETVTCFSSEPAEARRRFLAACDRIGLRVDSYPSRTTDQPGFCDVARMGSPDARRAAVLCSAAGGPAGLLGCGAALGVLSEGGYRDLPRDVALLLVHAANPRGPVWPAGEASEEPRAWSDSLLSGAERQLAAFRADAGEAGTIDWARLRDKPMSVLRPPGWDTGVLREIARTRLVGAEDVCIVDPRSGPGAFAQAITVGCDPPGSAGRARAEAWFTLDPAREAEALGEAAAPCAGGLGRLLPGARVTNVIVEIGTHAALPLLDARRSEAVSGYPISPVWRASAWAAVRRSLSAAYRGLCRAGE